MDSLVEAALSGTKISSKKLDGLLNDLVDQNYEGNISAYPLQSTNDGEKQTSIVLVIQCSTELCNSIQSKIAAKKNEKSNMADKRNESSNLAENIDKEKEKAVNEKIKKESEQENAQQKNANKKPTLADDEKKEDLDAKNVKVDDKRRGSKQQDEAKNEAKKKDDLDWKNKNKNKKLFELPKKNQKGKLDKMKNKFLSMDEEDDDSGYGGQRRGSKDGSQNVLKKSTSIERTNSQDLNGTGSGKDKNSFRRNASIERTNSQDLNGTDSGKDKNSFRRNASIERTNSQDLNGTDSGKDKNILKRNASIENQIESVSDKNRKEKSEELNRKNSTEQTDQTEQSVNQETMNNNEEKKPPKQKIGLKKMKQIKQLSSSLEKEEEGAINSIEKTKTDNEIEERNELLKYGKSGDDTSTEEDLVKDQRKNEEDAQIHRIKNKIQKENSEGSRQSSFEFLQIEDAQHIEQEETRLTRSNRDVENYREQRHLGEEEEKEQIERKPSRYGKAVESEESDDESMDQFTDEQRKYINEGKSFLGRKCRRRRIRRMASADVDDIDTLEIINRIRAKTRKVLDRQTRMMKSY